MITWMINHWIITGVSILALLYILYRIGFFRVLGKGAGGAADALSDIDLDLFD